MVIFTTNYSGLMEKICDQCGNKCSNIWLPDRNEAIQMRTFPNPPCKNCMVILKSTPCECSEIPTDPSLNRL